MISPATQLVERAVRGYVAKGSGLDSKLVIPGNRRGPVPKEPFASVLLMNELPDGLAWTLNEYIANRVYGDATFTDGPTFDVKTFLSSSLTFSVQWLRDGASDLARRFQLWARSPAGITEAARRGLTFYRTDPIRNLDDLDKEFWEERRQLDLFIGLLSTLVEDVGLFDSLAVDLHLDEFEGRDPAVNPISVPIPPPE